MLFRSYFPGLLMTTSYATAPLIISKPGKYTDDQFTANWDREFHGAQDKVAARFFFSDSESLLPFGAGGLQASLGGTLASSISATDLNFPYDIPVRGRFFSVNETHLFSPALVNDFRFGFVHINDSLINVPPVTVTDLGINRPTNNITKSIYKFTLGSSAAPRTRLRHGSSSRIPNRSCRLGPAASRHRLAERWRAASAPRI